MSKGSVCFSNDNEYYTPKRYVEMFGPFDYDPATTTEKAIDLGIPNYDTIETNGLLSDWTKYRKIWINPPFTDKKAFLEKAVDTYLKTKPDIFFLAPIEFLTTKAFHEQINKMRGGVKLFLPNGRIKFESGLGKTSKSPAFGSIVFKIQDSNELHFFDLNCNNVTIGPSVDANGQYSLF